MAEATTKPQPQPQAPVLKRFFIEPPVGFPIRFYPRADVREPALSATCLQETGRGMCMIEAHHPDGAVFRQRRTMHISDPKLILNPNRNSERPIGAWDWVEGLVPAKYLGIDNEAARIITLYQTVEKNCGRIAEIMGGEWTAQKVNGVLQKHKALDVQQKPQAE
jgi:hypothetical protein